MTQTKPRKKKDKYPHDEYIRKHFFTMYQTQIARNIGKSDVYVGYRANAMGLYLTPEQVRERRRTNAKKVCEEQTGIRKRNKLRYRPGHRIRILLSDNPGDFRVTYGQVIRVEEKNKPVVEYTNLSGLRLSDFDRHVYMKEVALFGPFHVHRERPGDDRVETKPYRTIKGDEY